MKLGLKLGLSDAIDTLRPNSSYILRGDTYSGLEWDSSNSDAKPTEEELVVKLAELQYINEVTSDYKLKRIAAYPSAGEQFDRIFHDGVEAWKGDIQGIKNVYPKTYPDPVELKRRQDKAVEDLKSS